MEHKEISKERLEDLYWKQEFPLSKIAETVGISKSGIAYHMEKLKVPRRTHIGNNPKKAFSGNVREKAYLLGLRTGDVNVRKHCRLAVACTTSPKKAQMKMFREAFEKYSRVNEYEAKGGFTERTRKINCYLDPSFEFLIEKPETIPDWILSDKKLFYSFLAGYCDCEASWIITDHKKYEGRWKDLVFSLGTCDKQILEQINAKLKELGFSSHLYLVRKKGIYGTRVCNLDLYRVMMMKHTDVVNLAETLLPLSKHADKKRAKLRLINYEKENTAIKLLKKKNRGTVNMQCTHCGNEKVWRNGFSKWENTKYLRYKCPACKKEFQRGKADA